MIYLNTVKPKNHFITIIS